jgi:RNA polymerase sigma-70 factor (ECF subfamily)
VGDLEIAEDAVQEACAAALTRWPAAGVPEHPRAWLIGVARHKATDRLRRESRRAEKEAAAMRDAATTPDGLVSTADDELGLILACCHPALDPAVRVPLTLRCVCGLPTAQIAAAFLVPEPTMAQRLVRAKRKIRQAGISLALPPAAERAGRLGGVLRVVYLVFTAGHKPSAGDLVLLADQDRSRWDRAKIAEGEALLTEALRGHRPGPYHLRCTSPARSCSAAWADAPTRPAPTGRR